MCNKYRYNILTSGPQNVNIRARTMEIVELNSEKICGNSIKDSMAHPPGSTAKDFGN